MKDIERLARAMCESDGGVWDVKNFNETSSGDDPQDQRDYWLAKARALLQELREPSEGMKKASDFALATDNGHGRAWKFDTEIRDQSWQAMIDHILSEAE